MSGAPSSFTIILLSLLILLASIYLAIFHDLLPSTLLDKDTRRPATTTTTYCYKHIKTQSPQLPRAQCISVSSDGLITKVYANIADAPRDHVHTADAAVIPGLWDGHGHLLQLGELLGSVDLFGSRSLEEALRRVGTYVDSDTDAGTMEKWIRGVGWDQAAFGRMPIADDFTASPLLKDRYIMLDRVDVHCIWVSNAVLRLLPEHIPSIPGGEIITDPGRGVFCDNAMDMVMRLWPQPSQEDKSTFIKTAMKKLNSVGIVGIHDAGVTPSTLQLFDKLVSQPAWTVRVYAMLECTQRNTFCPTDAAHYHNTNKNNRLWIRSTKLFADGALGSWGSAMLEPYSDRPYSRGSLLVNGSALATVTQQWAQAGYQVNIHAIGDHANRLAIDAFEAALFHICLDMGAKECQAIRRFRIEHAQIIHVADQLRMHALDIIPSIQPTHATSDMAYAEMRLGSERTTKEAYRMRSLLPLAPVMGSDFPVEPVEPLHGMYAAVTRKSPRTGQGKDGSETGWYIDEAIGMDEALDGFTINAARAAFLEDKAGKIEVGAFADWVVLDTPWDEISADDLPNIKVLETWIGGKKVYDRGIQQRGS